MKIVDPKEIEEKSFSIIETEVKDIPFKDEEWKIVRRMIHASADLELLSLVHFHPDAVKKGIETIRNGCFIIADTKMILAGVNKERLRRMGCKLRCFISNSKVKEIAKEKGITRAWVAMDFSIPYMKDSIFAIGNSPTALLRLLEIIEEKGILPSLIIGMPVGFVNVVEAKERLMAQEKVPYITIKGRKGGSHLAVSVINQLLELSL